MAGVTHGGDSRPSFFCAYTKHQRAYSLWAPQKTSAGFLLYG